MTVSFIFFFQASGLLAYCLLIAGHLAGNCESQRLCYNCRQPGHESSNCTQPRTVAQKKCYWCGGQGHVRADCPSLRIRSNQKCFVSVSRPSIAFSLISSPCRHVIDLVTWHVSALITQEFIAQVAGSLLVRQIYLHRLSNAIAVMVQIILPGNVESSRSMAAVAQ